jgi:spermidine synthase
MSQTPRFTYTDESGDLWFKEALEPAIGQSFKIEELIYADESEHQHILLFKHAIMGKVLVIDGLVQVTNGDEFIYHEMVTHVPLLAHGSAKSVLIIGGGDGGVMREIQRHKGVKRMVLVEIDPDVIKFSKEWMPEVSNGSFDDPRVEVIITDGVKYMAETGEKFDIIIIDSSDPVGPSAVLFTREFYASCKARLNPNGILVTQNGIPFMHPEPVRDSSASFASLFVHQSMYQITVPGFAGGPMTLGFATDNADAMHPKLEDLETRFGQIEDEFNYYNPRVHQGAFGLPSYIEKLIAK